MAGVLLSRSVNAVPVYIVGPDGETVNLSSLLTGGAGGVSSSSDALDTDGNPVPVYKAHSFSYDTSGNLVTDTVSGDTGKWVRTFTYVQGAQTADSGWVKQ